MESNRLSTQHYFYPLLTTRGHALVYTFDTQTEENGIASLPRTLGEARIEFKDLRSSESSLEDIFVSLVHTNKDDKFTASNTETTVWTCTA